MIADPRIMDRMHYEMMAMILFLFCVSVGAVIIGSVLSGIHSHEVDQISKGIESDRAVIKKLTLQRDECRMAKKIDG